MHKENPIIRYWMGWIFLLLKISTRKKTRKVRPINIIIYLAARVVWV